MEKMEKDQQVIADPRKNLYVVTVKRDKKLMLDFIKFDTRVRHPGVTRNMIILGAALLVLPIRFKGIALPGIIIAYVVGVLSILMGLFRNYLSLSLMRKNPEVAENEELTYLFGNSGIRVRQRGSIDEMGYYKNVYRLWEDEERFFIGMNEEDLLILPKSNFEEGDVDSFKAFILDKTGADYRWQPAKFMNVMKQTAKNIAKSMSQINLDQLKKREDR